MIDGVLYREAINTMSQERECRLIVPSTLRNDLLRLVHEGVTGGHAGISHTKDQVRRSGVLARLDKNGGMVRKSVSPMCQVPTRSCAEARTVESVDTQANRLRRYSVDTTGSTPT